MRLVDLYNFFVALFVSAISFSYSFIYRVILLLYQLSFATSVLFINLFFENFVR